MAEDYKLYKHFVEKLGEIGRLKRAWFTTFNLDISFFEKYMLSALLGKDYHNVKTPHDYEALSAELANDAKELDGIKTEVRVFYDYRTLKTEGKPKQSTVHLHPVDLKKINGIETQNFKDGVFHPKVILLEGYDGRYWLMVSSANLTMGGWARNRECFFLEQITTRSNARDINSFFSAITSNNEDFADSPVLKKLIRGQFDSGESNWSFISSFGSRKFIDALIMKNSKQAIRVWSPYFADDLSELINEYYGSYIDSIEVIPSKNENLKIRITEEAFTKCQSIQNLRFLQEKLPTAAQEAFVHAKVWLTPEKIAIGSWNMTRSGMNCSKQSNNNIEAGIVRLLSKGEYQSIIKNYPSKLLDNAIFSTLEELEEEKEDILDDYIISVELLLNWDDSTLKLINPPYDELVKNVGKSAFITLPGFGKQKIGFLKQVQNIRTHSRQFLNDRFFELSNAQNKTLYKGYLREIGLSSRPVNSFENIDDYLKGWVSKAPEDKTELHRLAFNTGGDDELSNQTKAILTGNDQNAWFTSFHAFECITIRIKETENVNELKRIGRVLPGSLSELKIHLENLVEMYKLDRSNFIKSPIYLWFLIEKANEVFSYFNNKINKKIDENEKIDKTERIERILNLNFEDAVQINLLNDTEKEGIEKWKKYILKKIKISM